MKQTVLQEILDTLENDWLSPQPYIDLVRSKLEKEMLQIINAYNEGSLSKMQYPDKKAIQNGEQYFNVNFVTKQS
tara:strand:+ start:445 stop:669 length:225 start_codon:yes stop_codon:yes gene_type:complete